MKDHRVVSLGKLLRARYPTRWIDGLDEANNLSRLLALFTVERGLEAAGADVAGAIVEVTDGTHDNGIDALAVHPAVGLVVVSQAKWRRDGRGSLKIDDVLPFRNGVDALISGASTGTPTRWTDELRDQVLATLGEPGSRVRLWLSCTGRAPADPVVLEPVHELLSKARSDDSDSTQFTLETLALDEIFSSLASPRKQPVALRFTLSDYNRVSTPSPAYYGRVSTRTVAAWFEEFGLDLFGPNLRVGLRNSEVNSGIMRTLRREPERFWYYNNGITLLAESISPSSIGNVEKVNTTITATGAAVVNGAQTVTTLGEALRLGFTSQLDRGFVSVRCIQVGADDDQALATKITRFANTQNEVSAQDYASLDEEQRRLSTELRAYGVQYVLREGEAAASGLSRTITVHEAAVALACCASSVKHAVTAKKDRAMLFDQTDDLYRALFNPAVSGLLVIRTVEVVRLVDSFLERAPNTSKGVAVHGNRVVAHLVLNDFGRRRLADPDTNFDAIRQEVGERADQALSSLVAHIPQRGITANLFKNQEVCAWLVERVRQAPAPMKLRLFEEPSAQLALDDELFTPEPSWPPRG